MFLPMNYVVLYAWDYQSAILTWPKSQGEAQHGQGFKWQSKTKITAINPVWSPDKAVGLINELEKVKRSNQNGINISFRTVGSFFLHGPAVRRVNTKSIMHACLQLWQLLICSRPAGKFANCSV